MASRIRFRRFYECDTESDRSLDFGADSLLYCLDTQKYYRIYNSSYQEVQPDEVIFISPIPISKLGISGIPDGTKFLRDDGSWSSVPGGADVVSGVGTAGQVTYWTGTNTISGESNLFWDAANNRLGIGTTTPSYTLQTNGDISVNGVLVGRGSGSIDYNTRVGLSSLASNTNGVYNSSFGNNSLFANTEGYHNSSFGYLSSVANTQGNFNSSFGSLSLSANTLGSSNSVLGFAALSQNTTGSNNVALGIESGAYISTGFFPNQTSSNSIYIGYQTRASANGNTNEIVIGYNVVGLGSNSTVIGNSSTTQSKLFGSLEVGTVNNATTDTDRFLVSDSGVIKYRTGSELLSDIGGQSALTNPITGTGTSGQVAYFNGTTSLTSESNLFWDATNDRLGIANASPSYNLDISGNGRVTGNSFLASSTGNVGIGTLTPTTFTNYTSMHLRGRTASGGSALLLSTSGDEHILRIVGDSDSLIGTYSSTTFSIFTNGLRRARFFANGNVGINQSTDAGFKLDINGTTRIQDTLTVSSGGALVTGLSSFTGTTASDGGQLGAELLSSSNWTSTGWTGDFVSGWTHSTGNTTALTNTLAAVIGSYYQISWTVTNRTAGTFALTFGGYSSGNQSATATVGPRATSTATLSITPTTDFDGTIVISIVVITQGSATVTIKNSSGTVISEIGGSTSNTNTFLGLDAGARTTTGTKNTFVGYISGQNNTSGANNTGYGGWTLENITTGFNNSAFGLQAINQATTAINNSAFGRDALYSTTTSSSNSAFGQNALYSITTTNNNSALGYNAGRYAGSGTTANQTSSNSLYLGFQSRAGASGNTNEVVIGYDVVGLGSNTTILGNSSTVTTGIYGNLLLGSTTDGGQRLQVTGDTIMKGTGNTNATSALTVQNSDAANVFRVRGDKTVVINSTDTYDGSLLLGVNVSNRVALLGNFEINTTGTPNWSGVGISVSGANRTLTIYGVSAGSINALDSARVLFNGSGGGWTRTSGTAINVQISDTAFAPTSGDATYAGLQLNSTINQVGSTGITRGLYVQPTLTAAADWRSIEWSNNTGWGLYGAGNAPNYLASTLSVGTTSTVAGYSIYTSQGVYSTGNLRFDTGIRDNRDNTIISQSASSVISNRVLTIGNATYLNINFPNGNVLIGSTTDTGELLQVNGTAKISTINNATTDTDRFLVSDSGVIKYRTGSELLSDIGGQSALTNPITGTGTSGQVAYFNGTTSLTSESNLFWDETNNRLGIGTSSPGIPYSLDIVSSTNGAIRAFGNNIGRLSLQNSTKHYSISVQGSDLFFFDETAGATRWRITSTGIFQSGGSQTIQTSTGLLSLQGSGNVAIGTTTDSGFKLDVNGTTRIQDTLTVSSGGALVTGLSSFTGTTASDGGQLGAELLSSSNWTSTGWTGDFVSGWTHSTGNTTALTNTLAAVNGTYYQIAYTVTGRTAGTFTIAFGGYTSGNLSSTGAVGPLATTTGTLSITPTTDFDGTIVISIKTIAVGSASISLRDSVGTVTNEIRNLTSNTNLAIGLNAGRRVTTGLNNTFVGNNSGINITTGFNNTSFGHSSLAATTFGVSNSSFGQSSLVSNTTGSNNSAFGQSSLGSLTSGTNNSAFGFQSLGANTTGINNTAFGLNAGRYAGSGTTSNQTSSTSIYLGYQTRASASGNTNEVVIGYNVVGLGSNTTILGNSSTVTTGIYGNLLLGSVVDGGQRLQVTGDSLLKGSGNTFATTALTVQNSDGSTTFRIRNDGFIRLGNAGANAPSFFNYSTVSSTVDLLGKNLSFYSFNSSDACINGRLVITGDSLVHTSGVTTNFGSVSNFSPTSGTATHSNLLIGSTINQTGGASGITRGLYVNPTLTSAADWRSIEWSNTSGWGLYGAGTANNYLAGSLGIGTTSLTGINLRSAKNITGGIISRGIRSEGQIQSDVTTQAIYFDSSVSQASGFTTDQVIHYLAEQQTFSGTVNTQYGFRVSGALIGASNNYGFYGNIASASGRWNIYMNGTAANYLNGNLLIGSTTDTGEKLQVTGSAKITGATTRAVVVQTNTDNSLVITTSNSGGDSYTVYENSGDANNAWAIGRGNDGLFRINYSTGATYGAGTTTNRLLIESTGQLRLNSYTTTSSFTGTAAGYLAFDSSGNVLTVAVPGALTDGDKGDITVSSSGTTWTIDNTAVTYAKIQDVTDNRLLGRSAGTSGSVQEITIGSGLSLSGGTLSSIAGGGSVTTVSVVSTNGFAGTVANATTTPEITISTTITGILKGNGTAISAATAGTDYLVAATLYTDYDSTITGLRNSSNKVFTTSFNFVSGSTRVFVNGLRYSLGASYDYQETGTNQITFTNAPDSGDLLIIEYTKS